MTLWLTSAQQRPCAPAGCQDAATTHALGLQLEANATRPKSGPLPSERPLTLKRRTVRLLFDPASGETRWLHAFGLLEELDMVAQCCPQSHLTDAAAVGGPDSALLSPTGRIAPIGTHAPAAVQSATRPEAEGLEAMLLASGWSWREADERGAH